MKHLQTMINGVPHYFNGEGWTLDKSDAATYQITWIREVARRVLRKHGYKTTLVPADVASQPTTTLLGVEVIASLAELD